MILTPPSGETSIVSFVDAKGVRWSEREIDPTDLNSLVKDFELDELLARLLVQRGLTERSEIDAFLKPSLASLEPPESLPDIDRAVERLVQAIHGKERVCVYGDYDVDGLTGTALLVRMFGQFGLDVDSYIPDRRREGFGLNAAAIGRLADSGVQLLITVDGGSNDAEEIQLALERGLDVVVTDHHPIHGDVPPVPVVHPGRTGADGPTLSPLSGVGVAYKLVWSLGKALGGGDRVTDEYREFMMAALVYVALGTVADVVPLTGDNRVLVHYGLRALEHTRHAGLLALAREGRVDPTKVDAEQVGFRLAPLLNAAGRVGDAKEALDLLLCDDERAAPDLAARLGESNRKRREVESVMLATAHEQIEKIEGGSAGVRTGVPIVVASEGWQVGVAGIVAARLVDHYRRPAFVLAIDGDVARGSARTVPEVPLTRFFDAARPEVISIGGHAMAGGVAVAPEAVDRFREVIGQEAVRHGEVEAAPRTFDAVLSLDRVNFELLEALEALAPYGAGNPIPRFYLPQLRLEKSPRLVGANEDHMQLMVTHDRVRVKAIAFRSAAMARPLQEHRQDFGLIAEVYRNDFRGQVSPELRVVAFDFGGEVTTVDPHPVS